MDNLEVDSVIYQPAVNKNSRGGPSMRERSTVRGGGYNEAMVALLPKNIYSLNIEELFANSL